MTNQHITIDFASSSTGVVTEERALTDQEKNFDTTGFAARDARLKRNCLLIETDWMAGSDVPSTVFTDAWKTYRQALRDLPAQSGFPDVDFPTKPS